LTCVDCFKKNQKHFAHEFDLLGNSTEKMEEIKKKIIENVNENLKFNKEKTLKLVEEKRKLEKEIEECREMEEKMLNFLNSQDSLVSFVYQFSNLAISNEEKKKIVLSQTNLKKFDWTNLHKIGNSLNGNTTSITYDIYERACSEEIKKDEITYFEVLFPDLRPGSSCCFVGVRTNQNINQSICSCTTENLICGIQSDSQVLCLKSKSSFNNVKFSSNSPIGIYLNLKNYEMKIYVNRKFVTKLDLDKNLNYFCCCQISSYAKSAELSFPFDCEEKMLENLENK
jgi:hypothetical protein